MKRLGRRQFSLDIISSREDLYTFRFLPDSGKACAEANLFHRGVDIIHGIFYDTGATRPSEEVGQENEDRDVWSHATTVRFVKNLWRDFTLDGDAVVITNVGGAGSLYMNAFKSNRLKTRLNSEKWAYSRNTPKTVFFG